MADPEKAKAFPVAGLLKIVPTLLLFTSFCLVLIVLLSPTIILERSTGLLEIDLDGNRTLALGPLGSCIRNTSFTHNSTCTSPSLTPVFARTYTRLSIPTALIPTLPFSFPLFPTSLVLALVLQALALGLLAIPALPRRAIDATAASNQLRKSLGIHGAFFEVLVIALGVDTVRCELM
ncbi:hypothetical protein RQP46_004721 [Phenoliferia psychrophenolica]